MPPYIESLEKMLASWNTADETQVRPLVEAALEHNVHFVDPNYNIMGREAFIDMVHAVKAKIPGAVYAHSSAVDMHNNHCRYHWTIHLGGKLIMDGFDVTEVNDAGKIVKVIGFFGPLEIEA